MKGDFWTEQAAVVAEWIATYPFFSLVFFAFVMHCVGQRCVANRRSLRRLAHQFGLLAFLSLLGVCLWIDGGLEHVVVRLIKTGIIAVLLAGIAEVGFAVLDVVMFTPAQQTLLRMKSFFRRSRVMPLPPLEGREPSVPATPIADTSDEPRDESRNADGETGRRQAARLDIRLFYDRHFPLLRSVFPESRFDEYADLFLADDVSVDVLEERVRLLKAMLEELLESRDRPDVPDKLDPHDYFGAIREAADQLTIDSDQRDAVEATLTVMQDREISRERN